MKRNRLLVSLAVAALAFSAAAPALASGVAATFAARVNGSYVGSNPLGSVKFGFDQEALAQFSAGASGAGKADLLYSGTTTLAASATANLDLAGVLTDPLGATLTFGHVKAIFIHASKANTNDFCIGGAGTNAFVGPWGSATDKVCIKPGGVYINADPGVGWAVTAATADLLKQANSGAGSSVSADVIIVGSSS